MKVDTGILLRLSILIFLCLVFAPEANGLTIIKLLADYERPYMYAIDQDKFGEPASLLIFDVNTEVVVKTLPIGRGVTDMTISYGEDRLYVTNWRHDSTQVVDLSTLKLLSPLRLGTDVFKVNAGRPDRIYYEEADQWIFVEIMKTSTGERIGGLPQPIREGDGEIDPAGNYYYHCDNNISNAHIHKYDISTDTPTQVARSTEHPYGSRNLVLSGDGSRLFWRGHIYDAALKELAYLGSEVYATTFSGDWTITSNQVFNTYTQELIYNLPITTTVLAVSGDQKKLFYFDGTAGKIKVIPMIEITDIPSFAVDPMPQNDETIVIPLATLSWDKDLPVLGYQVYLGEDETNAANADTNSIEFLGSTLDNEIPLSIPLELGKTYYWRVDPVGPKATRTGTVWSFTVAPVLVDPKQVHSRTVGYNPDYGLDIGITADGSVVPWEISESIPWLTLDHSSGTTPDVIEATFSTYGMFEGIYQDTLWVTSGSYHFAIPVELEFVLLDFDRFLTDYERPYIYATDKAYGVSNNAYLAFINTNTEQIEKVISIGANPTDMTINYGEGRLYVTNWKHDSTRVVDLNTQEELPPLLIGAGAYKINAGRPGRIYYEEYAGQVPIKIINTTDTATGQIIDTLAWPVSNGDGEVDPSGNFYYHSNYGSDDINLIRYDISDEDHPTEVFTRQGNKYGLRNLLISYDGSRLYWQEYVYDSDLNVVDNLGEEIYATTIHGELAFGASHVFDTYTGDIIYSLPVASTKIAVSGDQKKLFYYDEYSRQINVASMADIADVPGLGLHPIPADGQTVFMPFDRLSWDIIRSDREYRVYFGTDSATIAAADTTAMEYIGDVFDDHILLPTPPDSAGAYYWRLDRVGFSSITRGSVWSVNIAPIVVDTNQSKFTTFQKRQDFGLEFELRSNGSPEPWKISESIPWLSLVNDSGATPGTITAIVSTEDMAAGTYRDSLLVSSGSYQFAVPIEMNLLTLELTNMLADNQRPYIYALHRGSGIINDAYLLFINTNTELVEKVMPIGSNPTDLTINYADSILYVTNWEYEKTWAIDLNTREELPPLLLGRDVLRISAGRAGRLCYVGGSASLTVVDTYTGEKLGDNWHAHSGDVEVNLEGNNCYHAEEFSGARLRNYDISTDEPVEVYSSPVHASSGHDLLMSPDGNRLFWNTYVYDAELNVLNKLGRQIYSTTSHGDLAFTASRVLNSHTGDSVFAFPVPSNVLAVSSDQKKLFLFNGEEKTIDVIPMDEIASVTDSLINPIPADNETVVPSLDTLSWEIKPATITYRVYFGEDVTRVDGAELDSAEFLGDVFENHLPLSKSLELKKTYYWRVDQIGLADTMKGAVWSFTVASIRVNPDYLIFTTATGAADQSLPLGLATDGAVESWEISESIPWLKLEHSSGVTPDTVEMIFSTDGLAEGMYQDTLWITSGIYSFSIPIQFELITLEFAQMLADLERPYVYAFHKGSRFFNNAYLAFINTGTEQIEKMIPIGSYPSDMSIDYSTGRLYVTNYMHDSTRIVDLTTQKQLPPLLLGTEVYKINASALGRIYYEGYSYSTYINTINSSTGALESRIRVHEGDGEIDPGGNYYYHCDNTSSPFPYLHKYDISSDIPVEVAVNSEYFAACRNLILSGDGRRLFMRGFIFDADLNGLLSLGSDIYATTLHGDLAFGTRQVFNGHTGDSIYTLPVVSRVVAVSGDQEKFFYYDEGTKSIKAIPLADIAISPDSVSDPIPTDKETIILPLDELTWNNSPAVYEYQAYFGEDEASVTDADMSSAEFVGSVIGGIPISKVLDPGKTYYWRVDQTSYSGFVKGSVWSFTVAPIIVKPNKFNLSRVVDAPDFEVELELAVNGSSEPWEISESIPWLSLDHSFGATPDTLRAMISTTGMSEGIYRDTLRVTSNSYQFGIPVEIKLVTPELTKMLADLERPYIYGLHSGSSDSDDTYLVFINTITDKVDQILPIGMNPTDMTINYGEDKLYVTNWGHDSTQVVELTTQELLPPLRLGTDVYKINAGRTGRIYYEGYGDGLHAAYIVDTYAGQSVADIWHVFPGDGEVSPDGNYYYHCEYNSSRAKMHIYDITTDSPREIAYGQEHRYGSRNLVMSPDGSHLFWQGYIYDASLNELGRLDGEIYATTFNGDLAFDSSYAFKSNTGEIIHDLPVTTNVMAVSGDQKKLYLFDANTRAIYAVSLFEIVASEVRPTNESINLYCGGATLNGVPLSSGDVIKAFDPDGMLCGIDTVRSDGHWGFMPVYRDDPFSSIDEGAVPGDLITFEINGTPAITGATSVAWTVNGESYEVCDFFTAQCRHLDLETGWSLISWNVAYASDISGFIDRLSESDCVELILGFDQEGQTYDPKLVEYSTLSEVDYHHGYWVKLSCDASFDICGYPIASNDFISVNKGWNLISFWPSDAVSVEEGFNEILDRLNVAQSLYQTGVTWLPEHPDQNTLTQLIPHYGYWVKLAESGVLTYSNEESAPAAKHFAPDKTAQDDLVVSSQWMSLYGAGLTIDDVEIADNSLIEIFTADGHLCGTNHYHDGILKFTPIYGSSNQIESLPWLGDTLDVHVNGVPVYPRLTWSGSGKRVGIGRFSKQSGSELPDRFELEQNHPNPFNPITQIGFALPKPAHVNLVVYNVLGQRVATLADKKLSAGRHSITWDASSVASGVYIYRIRADEFEAKRKMILIK